MDTFKNIYVSFENLLETLYCNHNMCLKYSEACYTNYNHGSKTIKFLDKSFDKVGLCQLCCQPRI